MAQPNPEERTVTVAEAVALTGLTKKALQSRLDRGRLPFTVKDRLRRIAVGDLYRAGLLDSIPPAPEQRDEVDELLERIDRTVAELGGLAAELRARLKG